MAFASRKDEEGIWRLCKRMGCTFGALHQKWPHIEIRFTSAAKAKACSDALNEQYWKAYDAGKTKPEGSSDLFWPMVQLIRDHGGITDREYEEMTQ